jgi:general secretion pathway protein D
VKKLDAALPQALIKVLIAEVTHDKGSDIGAEFTVYNDEGTSFEDSAGTNFGLGIERTGMIVQILDEEFDVTLRAIAEAGKLEVLSRPSIIAVNNQQANITVGKEVPRVTNSRVTSDGQVINEVDYEDVGIILDVTPHINTDGVVTLDVSTEISTLTGEIVQTSDSVAQPIIAKRTALTRVVVPDRKTIIIGGLMEDQNTETITKVPWIGDVPWLGKLFQRRIESKSKTELMIFLTPNVVQEYEGIAALTESEKSKADLTPNSFDGERFQEHLLEMEI